MKNSALKSKIFTNMCYDVIHNYIYYEGRITWIQKEDIPFMIFMEQQKVVLLQSMNQEFLKMGNLGMIIS